MQSVLKLKNITTRETKRIYIFHSKGSKRYAYGYNELI